MNEMQEKYPLVLGSDNEKLRVICDKIEKITPEIKQFWEDLLVLMHLYDGVWIAAPQVWRTIRMFAFTQFNMKGKKRKQTMEGVMINPTILSKSSGTEIAEEWCLSLPWVWWDVERVDMVVVEYTTLQWKKEMHKAYWYNARILLHEIDHLDWVLFIDKLV